MKHLSWGYEKSKVFIYALVSIFVVAKAKEKYRWLFAHYFEGD